MADSRQTGLFAFAVSGVFLGRFAYIYKNVGQGDGVSEKKCTFASENTQDRRLWQTQQQFPRRDKFW